jgi:hypothetical protein
MHDVLKKTIGARYHQCNTPAHVPHELHRNPAGATWRTSRKTPGAQEDKS